MTVEFGPGGDIVAAECTCPYDWGGDCKHIIATLLCLVHRSQEEEIVDAGKAGEYDVAIRWLRCRRDILLAAGRKAQWTPISSLSWRNISGSTNWCQC
ncbi:MAG: SWIM zinc finger family protein [Anaerolineae bacterium]|nr:SWIM zinc finger family protein [Anaerolineae bacterium]